MIDVNELHEEGVMTYEQQKHHCIGLLRSLKNGSKIKEQHPDPKSHDDGWELLEQHIFSAFNALRENE